MKTIDLTKVPENPSVFSDLISRDTVAEAMRVEPEVSHIEDVRGNVLIVEMESGLWVSIPKTALVSGRR